MEYILIQSSSYFECICFIVNFFCKQVLVCTRNDLSQQHIQVHAFKVINYDKEKYTNINMVLFLLSTIDI